MILAPAKSVEQAKILAHPKAVGDLVGKSSATGEIVIGTVFGTVS